MGLLDCIKGIIDLFFICVGELFNVEIDITDNFSCSIGVLIVSFVTFLLIIYFVFKALKIKGDD